MNADKVPCSDPHCRNIAFRLDCAQWAPCPHGSGLCGEHNLDGCMDCRLDAEAHMA